MSKNLKISIVIPSLQKERRDNLLELIKDIKSQELKPDEIIIVIGVKPRTRAHNLGAKKALGDIIIFFDDDVRLGNKFVIKNMLEPFLNEENVGIAGTSLILPPDASLFERNCASQLLRAEFGIVKETIESDMATHAALAIWRDLYWEIGGENESLRMNDDLYLRYRVREKGYKVLVVKNTWVYHSQPTDLITLVKKYFIQGIEQAFDYRLKPDLIYESPLRQGEIPRKSNLFNQIIRNIKIILGSMLKIKPVLFISRLATVIGFVYGYTKSPADKGYEGEGEIEIIKIK